MSSIEFTAEDIERAHADLADLCSREIRVDAADAEAIARQIAARHQMTIKEMLGPNREHEYVVARSQLYRALRARGWSFPRIGRFAGGRDHTTVMAAIRGQR